MDNKFETQIFRFKSGVVAELTESKLLIKADNGASGIDTTQAEAAQYYGMSNSLENSDPMKAVYKTLGNEQIGLANEYADKMTWVNANILIPVAELETEEAAEWLDVTVNVATTITDVMTLGADEEITIPLRGASKKLKETFKPSKQAEDLGGGCFIAGTQVLTCNGFKSIEKISTGDTVWAFNSNTCQAAKQVVKSVFVRRVGSLIKLIVDTNVIWTTDEHPFYVNNKWTPAHLLKGGDSVFLFDRTKREIKSIERKDSACTVYNFAVNNFSSYYISNISILVHNNCAPSASNWPVTKKGTPAWEKAKAKISDLKKGRNNVRVESASDAKTLLKDSKGNMNRYKNYTKTKYKKGYETHNTQNESEKRVGNDLQHIKWKDGKATGHIYYEKPN